uniref:NADH-ubiquinone oxidoreductase chain 3 n=1 Tax=Echinolaelaps echidninus TaxID=2759148 RepID=A0AB74RXN1_9ACAR
MIYMMIIMLSFFLILISFFICYKQNLDKEMILSFECGFDPFYMVRTSFSLHYFKICLVFIFFDIEIIIVLLMPLVLDLSVKFLIIFFLMLLVILLGLFFEWYQGSINWFY